MRSLSLLLILIVFAVWTPLARAQDAGTAAVLDALAGITAVRDLTVENNIASVAVDVAPGTDLRPAAAGLLAVVQQDAPAVAEMSIVFSDGSSRVVYEWSATSGRWSAQGQAAEAAPTTAASAVPVLTFSSAQDGQQPVLGPLTLPSGAYIVTVTTDGFLIADVQTLSGECSTQASGMFNLSSGRASDGAETLFASNNCEMLLSISNTREPWTLTFQPYVSTADVRNAADPLTSAAEGLYAVIGPVVFADGTWRATATTDGYLIVDYIPVTGTCDTARGSLFNISAGQANQGAQTVITAQDCAMMLATWNAGEPWTLEFEQLR